MGFYGDFKSLSFKKKGKDILEKASSKLQSLHMKIEDRTKQIQEIVKDNKLDVAQIFANIEQYAGNASGALGVGDQEKLKRLATKIRDERIEGEKLELIVRNLDPSCSFELTFEELQYFGF